MLVAVLILFVYWYKDIEVPLATTWFVVIVSIMCLRLIDSWQYRKSEKKIVSYWSRRFFVGAMLGGLAWGLSCWMAFPDQHEIYQSGFIFGMVAVVSGAMSSLAFDRKVYITFISLILLLLVTKLLYLDTELGYLLAMGVFVYWIYIMQGSKIIDQSTTDSIMLRLEAIERENDLDNIQQKQTFHVEHTRLAVIEWDAFTRITEWNPAAESIFGLDKKQSLGQTITEVIQAADDSHDQKELWETIKQSQSATTIEYAIKASDGHVRNLIWHITPILSDDGWVTGGASMALDVTEQNEARAQLIAAKDEAEKANLAKSKFLSSMSHELRTPLNAVIGFSQLMMLEDDEEQVENSRHIHQAGQHLLTLINGLLDLEKIEAGKLALNITEVDVKEIIQESLLFIQQMADDRNISLTSEINYCDVHVHADAMRLKQCLLNLLSNAVKYNHDEGQVTLSCSLVNNDSHLRISIEDDGSGISEEAQQRLFTPFDRLGKEGGHVEGNGIGLVISRELILMMGGEIGMQSAEGKGSTFWIELPILK